MENGRRRERGGGGGGQSRVDETAVESTRLSFVAYGDLTGRVSYIVYR